MIRSKGLMLPLVASVAMLLVFSASPTYSQSSESTEDSTETPSTENLTETITTTMSPTTSATASVEETTLMVESTTSTVTVPSTTTTTTTTSASIDPPVYSQPPPEGGVNSPCNTTLDCQPLKSLECVEGVCHCPVPQVFDLRVFRCVIPLGKKCDSSDILGENMCPEFAECFMDHCVCKTGYSMHTLTRCKSDLIEASGDRKHLVLWPLPSADKEESDDEKGSCNSETCDESKGLTCQESKCKCKDSKEIYIDEFGRCLNTTVQKTLKDALSIVGSNEDEIKSFVKLLEKIDDADQKADGPHKNNSPIHQLLGLLGGTEYQSDAAKSQIAPPNYGDLHSAAQEHVQSKTAMPSGGSSYRSAANISPVSAANAETSAESGEAMAFAHQRRPSPSYSSLPLDNYRYTPQSQAIVQRQAPPYLEGGGLQGIGNTPATGSQYSLPIQDGYSGGGGLSPYGGQLGLPGGLGGFGGFGGGLNGYGSPAAFGGYPALGYPGGFRNPETVKEVKEDEAEPVEEEKKEGLLIDVAEFVGRSLKLVDRFLPLIQAINDAIKKEGIFEKKEGGFFASIASAIADAKGKKFGEASKEAEEEVTTKDEEGGDDTLKKLLT